MKPISMRSTISARSTGSIGVSACRRAFAPSYAQQDIVNSEQPDAGDGGDLGEPDIGDSGISFIDNRRRRASLRPSVSFDVSQRNELQFDAGYTDVNFERQVSECARRTIPPRIWSRGLRRA